MKQKLNFIIDALMFLLIAAVTGLGFLMKYILVPGKDRLAKFGHQVDLYFRGLDRHEWGTIHLILGFVLLGLLVLHIVLHWQSIRGLFNRLIGKKAWRMPLVVAFSILSLFLLFFAFIVHIDIEEAVPGEGHYVFYRPVHRDSSGKHEIDKPSSAAPLKRRQSVSDIKQKRHGTHDHANTDIRVQGFMTLEQVAVQYDIPVSSILSGLKIEDQIPPTETLGRLKKKYPFQMTDVENIIRLFKNDINE